MLAFNKSVGFRTSCELLIVNYHFQVQDSFVVLILQLALKMNITVLVKDCTKREIEGVK